jgi:hypothetical protein
MGLITFSTTYPAFQNWDVGSKKFRNEPHESCSSMLHGLSYLGEKLNEFNGYIKRINPSVTAVSHIM